jgi:hypothetical protein
VRTLAAVMEAGADIINMSYGEVMTRYQLTRVLSKNKHTMCSSFLDLG